MKKKAIIIFLILLGIFALAVWYLGLAKVIYYLFLTTYFITLPVLAILSHVVKPEDSKKKPSEKKH